MIKRVIPVILTLLLTACGFHLRGMTQVPNWLNHLAILSKNKQPELISLLKSQLQSYQIEVSTEQNQAPYWLIINNVDYQQQIVSVGANTNIRQFQLVLTVGFSLQSKEGKILSPVNQVSVMRQLTTNNDRILGSNEEERIIKSEMQLDAVIQIVKRLSRIQHVD